MVKIKCKIFCKALKAYLLFIELIIFKNKTIHIKGIKPDNGESNYKTTKNTS